MSGRRMNTFPHAPQPLAENLWLLVYPLKVLGADVRRNVTLIRLRTGQLVIHSTAPFTPGDVAAIRALGEPGWLLEGVLRHDTFARQGRAAFPEIPYLAPEGFSEAVGFPTTPIVPAPADWAGRRAAGLGGPGSAGRARNGVVARSVPDADSHRTPLQLRRQ